MILSGTLLHIKYDDVVTLGDLIVIAISALTLVLAVIPIVIAIYKYYYEKRHPFWMRFTNTANVLGLTMLFSSQSLGQSGDRLIIIGGSISLSEPPSPDRVIRYRAFDGKNETLCGKVVSVVIDGKNATLMERGDEWSDWALRLPSGINVSLLIVYEKRQQT